MTRSLNQWIALLLIGLLLSSHATASDDWETDIKSAVTKAKQENKFVLVRFTGSDWCPPCQMIHKAVFSKQKFVKKASQTYILCIIDSPDPEKKPKLAEKYNPLLRKYSIQGFPTVILLDKTGKEFSRYNSAAFPTVKGMLKQLAYQIRRKDMF